MESEQYEILRRRALEKRLSGEEWAEVRRQAMAGEVGAQFLMGFSSATARTKKKWLKRAAENGHPEAFKIFHGDGYPCDNTGGWLEGCARRGCADAQFAFAIYHARQPERDEKAMCHWYRQAALQGHPAAMYEVGFSLILGEGGPPDPVEGVAWLEKSATIGGHIHTAGACGLLADLFEHGSYGVAQDSEKSSYWRALEKRHSGEPL